MRLLWLIDSLTLGGAERLVLTFAREARNHDLELTVCCLKTIGGNPLEEKLRETGVEVVNLESRNLRDRGAFRRLLHLIRKRQIDVIHAHLAYASIWGAVASRLTGVPMVATVHVAPSSGGRFGREVIRQRLLSFVLSRWAFRVVAVSGAIRDAWIAAKLVKRKKAVVIHNGVDLSEPPGRHILRLEVAIDASTLLLGSVAVLREGKGINVLLHALQRVPEEIDFAAVIVGDGPQRLYLQQLSTELGLAGRVRFLGYREDVSRLYPNFDIFVHPTMMDAFPTAVLEAMVASKPVIASDVGGVPEIVDDGESGILVPPADSEALAGAIVRLARDPSERSRLGRNGRHIVEERFAVAKWMSELRQLYEEARR